MIIHSDEFGPFAFEGDTMQNKPNPKLSEVIDETIRQNTGTPMRPRFETIKVKPVKAQNVHTSADYDIPLWEKLLPYFLVIICICAFAAIALRIEDINQLGVPR